MMIETRLPSSNNVLVVLSGGQDSATCLIYALATRQAEAVVHAIAFNYGQKHAVELECAQKLCDDLNVKLMIVDFDFLKGVSSALIQEEKDVSDNHERLSNLPASFVPNRNALFLTMAHAMAGELGCQEVWTGVCQTDYSGYPDCRQVFIGALNHALSVGYESTVQIVTPLMYATKAETFGLAARFDKLETIVEDTHTCYNGDHETKHEWGYGCAECPACQLRAKGFEQFKSGKYEPVGF